MFLIKAGLANTKTGIPLSFAEILLLNASSLLTPLMLVSRPLQSLLRAMIKELHQDLQPLIAGELFVKVAVDLFSFSEGAKFFSRSFPRREYKLGSGAFRANFLVINGVTFNPFNRVA